MGPLTTSFGTPVNTKPAVGPGIFNNTVGTAAAAVLQVAAANRIGKAHRVKICSPLAGRNLGWTLVDAGAPAPTLTAVGDGTATDGSLVCGGGGATEWITIPDSKDLYLAASAVTTPYQLTVEALS